MSRSSEISAPADDGPLLPILKRYPVIAGAIFGVLLRLVFSGQAGSRWSAMTESFIYVVPIVVGMLTVYLAERQRRRSWRYYAVAPCAATALFVAGTMLMLIEGLVCAVVIIPMFAVLGALGGLVMGAVCRLTDWPKPVLYSAGVLPMLLASLGPLFPTPAEIGSIERSVVINAPAAVVWRQLNDIDNIQPDEMARAWAMRIGVPLPMSGKTRQTPQGLVRESRWGKMVHFDEVIEEWQPERYLRWTYRFAPDSFPRQALDDHVVIGGHYFDLIDTSYTLSPEGEGGATRLTTRVQYRISTQFNFYADWAAQFLLGNLCEVGLHLYKRRSERDGTASR
jgi:uncharacterized protein YndB with AHSA1/START domain